MVVVRQGVKQMDCLALVLEIEGAMATLWHAVRILQSSLEKNSC